MNTNDYLGCTIGLFVVVCFIIVMFMPIRRQNRTGRIPTTGGIAAPEENGTVGGMDYRERIDEIFKRVG